MKKVKLQLDEIRVNSFETTAAKDQKGTVFGEQCTCWTNCTCPGCPTCDASCGGGTCEPTSPDPVGTCCGYQC
ncbi:MAG TPA: hypothetical protein VGB24_04215 [Longimicrobium sp.]|jgi:hypothetical protein|uniref:hypothetical protein n=1 Tax=Longimicrobium sp. TaxID=2029185 RepID=UPI002ED95278